MKNAFARFIYKLLGWKTKYDLPKELKKYVVVGAPHTSNWDGIFSPLGVWAMDLEFRFFVKKELFRFPFGGIIRWAGGLPVDRKKKEDLTTQVANYFKNSDSLIIGITPEGTRSPNPKWKKGFYYIAQKANVPIAFGYLDYKQKICGIGPLFEPSGDIEKDMLRLKKHFTQYTPKHPEKFKI